MPTLTDQSIGPPPPITPAPPSGGRGDGNGSAGDPSGASARIAIWIGMCASTMTFTALLIAMVVRRGLGNHDWHRIPVSPILWWNTCALLLSSVVIEAGRRAFRSGSRPRFRVCWLTGTALGTWFLLGQSLVWFSLARRGFYIRHNPASAFFFILTWAHAAHVLGALAALYYVACRLLFFPAIPGNRTVIDVSSIFWHFLDVMWLLLMSVFVFWGTG
jgi:cytochrome c oxidase subunit 3